MFKITSFAFSRKYVDTEAPPIIAKNRPPPDWPTNGAISYRDYDMRYREGLPLVLHGLNCDILPREKVGIVGRTGSGKISAVEFYRFIYL